MPNCNSCKKTVCSGCTSQSNECNKCSTETCKCHPCYNTLIGTCSVQPINQCLVPTPCTDGCEEVLYTDCILFPDGTNLTDYLTNLLNLVNNINNTIGDCCNDPAPVNLTLNCSGDQTINLTVPGPVTWPMPTASTDCANTAITITQLSGPVSGSTLNAGTYTVTYLATDTCGNNVTCSMEIVVVIPITVPNAAMCIDCGTASTFTALDIVGAGYDLNTFQITNTIVGATITGPVGNMYTITPTGTTPLVYNYTICNTSGSCGNGTITFTPVCKIDDVCLPDPILPVTVDLTAQIQNYQTGGTWMQNVSCTSSAISVQTVNITNPAAVSLPVAGFYNFTYNCDDVCIPITYHIVTGAISIDETPCPGGVPDCIRLIANTTGLTSCTSPTYTWIKTGGNVTGVTFVDVTYQEAVDGVTLEVNCGDCLFTATYANAGACNPFGLPYELVLQNVQEQANVIKLDLTGTVTALGLLFHGITYTYLYLGNPQVGTLNGITASLTDLVDILWDGVTYPTITFNITVNQTASCQYNTEVDFVVPSMVGTGTTNNFTLTI
jgi:HYR domain